MCRISPQKIAAFFTMKFARVMNGLLPLIRAPSSACVCRYALRVEQTRLHFKLYSHVLRAMSLNTPLFMPRHCIASSMSLS